MPVELLNRQVQFKVCDIYIPDPQTVMGALYANRTLEGRVLSVTESDSGAKFAFVEVKELENPVVVSVERIRDVGSTSS